MNSYPNLRAAASTVALVGSITKYLGLVVFAIGLLGAFNAGSNAKEVVFISASASGFAAAICGVFMAAVGESMHALADIAVNTRPIAELVAGMADQGATQKTIASSTLASAKLLAIVARGAEPAESGESSDA